MTNNPLELKPWVQTYNLNDHIDFGDRMHFFKNRDFLGRITDFHVDGWFEQKYCTKYICL